MAVPSSWISEILAPVIRPTARLVVGLIAIPLLRKIRKKFQPDKQWDEEFEKDLEQWVRASLVLMLATKNVESSITAWVMEKRPEISIEDNWWFAIGRLLLAIGVIESMPDQQLFSIIHPGPRRPNWVRGIGFKKNFQREFFPLLKGVICLHLNRSSPVFAILSVIFNGTAGWVFFFLAITQYLIIGLVTSRDKAVDILSQFDMEVAERRKAIMQEMDIRQDSAEKSNSAPSEHAVAIPSGLMSAMTSPTTDSAQQATDSQPHSKQ
ncbi:DNA topoisomerase I [Planctomicrobium sp. SH527]|uniref:DNA topoisomerase I n=1 Tax=Planctomicrobium sp. SH527 TaxID=3448123 RepID=UPI003F5B811E